MFQISRSQVLIFKIPKFQFSKFQVSKFQVSNSTFQVSKKKKSFQGITKICQGFRTNGKIQIKKEQMKITYPKNNGTKKPSSFKM